MENGVGKFTKFFTVATDVRRRIRRQVAFLPLDNTLGHFFRYIHPKEPATSSAFSISGASVSVNASTPLPIADPFTWTNNQSSIFESSTSFTSAPLDRGFMSCPLNNPISGDGFLQRRFSHGFKRILLRRR